MFRISKGLTLIELLISIMLVSAMIGAVYVVYSVGFSVFYGRLSRHDIKDETTLALINITRELRQASSVTVVAAKSVTFAADTDSNGVNETIQYTWSGAPGAPLNRVSGTSTKALVRSVQNMEFAYYDTNNIRLIVPVPVILDNVRLVTLDITAVKDDETFHLRTKIFLQTYNKG